MSRFASTAAATIVSLNTFAACSSDIIEQEPDQPAAQVAALHAVQPVLGRVVSATEYERMKQYVQDLYDPSDVAHNFRHGAGYDVDCVEATRQFPVRVGGAELRNAPRSAGIAPVQEGGSLWHGTMLGGGADPNGRERACPQGTVPTRHIDDDYIRNYTTLEDMLGRRGSRSGMQMPAAAAANHQYSVAMSDGTVGYGSSGRVSLWNPPEVEGTTGAIGVADFSLVQLWAGANVGQPTHESVEAGAIKLAGTAAPVLFVYFDPDNYGNLGATTTKGCWNSLCPDSFVQTNNTYVLGGQWDHYNVDGGDQFENQFTFIKDDDASDWWLYIDGNAVGYWPRKYFDDTGIANNASAFWWGGEITDSITASAGRHTITDMGSGRFATEQFGHSAYTYGLAMLTGQYPSNSWNLTPGFTTRDTPGCYDMLVAGTGADTTLWFGGPGYDPTNCP